MSSNNLTVTHITVVEEEVQLTVDELCRACRAHSDELQALIEEGILTPSGDDPAQWLFRGDSLRRGRAALRLMRDLELNPSAVALVLDLLDEIEALKSQLRQRGGL